MNAELSLKISIMKYCRVKNIWLGTVGDSDTGPLSIDREHVKLQHISADYMHDKCERLSE